MSKAKLGDLKSIRKALGKSQQAMADLLGVSIRAIQSYEQGWREMPSTVQRLAGLLLMCARRHQAALQPCWKVRRCDPQDVKKCAASQFGEGMLCWAVTGDACNGKGKDFASWDDKLAACQKCGAMKQWLSV